MSDCQDVPFEFGIETLTWVFTNGDRIQVERNTSGYFISGRIDGKDWHDDDHEDFFCSDTDEYLDFLERHGLLRILSIRPEESLDMVEKKYRTLKAARPESEA